MTATTRAERTERASPAGKTTGTANLSTTVGTIQPESTHDHGSSRRRSLCSCVGVRRLLRHAGVVSPAASAPPPAPAHRCAATRRSIAPAPVLADVNARGRPPARAAGRAAPTAAPTRDPFQFVRRARDRRASRRRPSLDPDRRSRRPRRRLRRRSSPSSSDDDRRRRRGAPSSSLSTIDDVRFVTIGDVVGDRSSST